MKKRVMKKSLRKMASSELFEHVAYCENKRLRKIAEKEFDKRFEGVNREILQKKTNCEVKEMVV